MVVAELGIIRCSHITGQPYGTELGYSQLEVGVPVESGHSTCWTRGHSLSVSLGLRAWRKSFQVGRVGIVVCFCMHLECAADPTCWTCGHILVLRELGPQGLEEKVSTLSR